MLISEFVKKYNQTKQKNAIIEKQIKTHYMPYQMKILFAQNIVKHSMHKEINGKDTFVFNTPVRYVLFVRAVIDHYTTLEWDKRSDGNELDIANGFNLLEENGLVEVLIAAIGDDVTKFTTVLNMVVDDETDLHRSLIPFIETKIDVFSMAYNTLSQALETPEIKNKIVDFLGKSQDVVEKV